MSSLEHLILDFENLVYDENKWISFERFKQSLELDKSKIDFYQDRTVFLYAVEKLNEIGFNEKEIYSRKLGNYMYLPIEPLGLLDSSVVYGDMIDRDYDNNGYRVFKGIDEENLSVDDFENSFGSVDFFDTYGEEIKPLDFNDDTNLGGFDDYFNLFS